jgi:hypothetical protein
VPTPPSDGNINANGLAFVAPSHRGLPGPVKQGDEIVVEARQEETLAEKQQPWMTEANLSLAKRPGDNEDDLVSPP